MKIDLNEIKNEIMKGNIKEIHEQTGIPYRTVQNWRHGKNKWFDEASERLTNLQKYIDEKRK